MSAPGLLPIEDGTYPARGFALAMLRGVAPDAAIDLVTQIKHKGAETFDEFAWVREVVRIADTLDGGLTAEKVYPGTVAPDETAPKKIRKRGV